jgi:hypothetical protein
MLRLPESAKQGSAHLNKDLSMTDNFTKESKNKLNAMMMQYMQPSCSLVLTPLTGSDMPC